MDEQSGGNSPDAAKAAGGDALLTLVTNGKKQNAVDAGLVTKTSDKALASVTTKGGTGAGALAAKKKAKGTAGTALAPGKRAAGAAGAVGKTAGKGAAAGAADAAGLAADAALGGKNPMKKRILSAGGAGAASGAEASLYVDSDDIGAQAAEELRSGTVTGAKGALRAGKFIKNRKVKVGHAAKNAEKTAKKAKGASSLVSNAGKGQVKKIAGRSAAKKTAQMQTALKARQAAMVAKAATSKGAAAIIYKIIAAIVSAIITALPIIAIVLAIVALIALIIVLITTLITFLTSWLHFLDQQKASYGNLQGNERVVAKFLSEQGLSTMQIAGIMGSIKGENEAYDPTLLQEVPASGCPGGNYDNYPEEWIGDPYVGYGICQWSAVNRSQGLVDYAAEQGKNSGDINIQVEYLWQELNTTYQASVLDPILEATSVEDVCLIWSQYFEVFEGASDINNESNQKRIGYAQEYLEKLKSGASSDLVSWARSKVGLWYEWGAQGMCQYGTGREEYDCSGLVDQALYECGYGDVFSGNGDHGPNTDGILAYARTNWDEINESEIKDGDIALFFGYDDQGAITCYHVAITTDGGGLIEAAGTRVHDKQIEETNLWRGDAGNRYFRPKAA